MQDITENLIKNYTVYHKIFYVFMVFAHRVVTRHEVHRQHAGLRDICNRCVCVCTA